jgi:hypothetical protein
MYFIPSIYLVMKKATRQAQRMTPESKMFFLALA